MDLGESGMEVVAYLYEHEKLCKECFHKAVPPGSTVRFGVVRRAVQVQSEWVDCDHCQENILTADHLERDAEQARQMRPLEKRV